jgi:hypothetical protein
MEEKRSVSQESWREKDSHEKERPASENKLLGRDAVIKNIWQSREFSANALLEEVSVYPTVILGKFIWINHWEVNRNYHWVLSEMALECATSNIPQIQSPVIFFQTTSWYPVLASISFRHASYLDNTLHWKPHSNCPSYSPFIILAIFVPLSVAVILVKF